MKLALGLLTAVSRLSIVASLFVALTAAPAHANGIPAFNFTSAVYRIDDPDTAELGFTFTTGNAPVTIGALGYVNDGFNATHTVAIFNFATQQAVPGALATVTTVGGDGNSNSFTYTDLASPVTLDANTEYQIVSQFFAGEYYFTYVQGLAAQPGLTFGQAVYDYYGAPPASPDFARSIAWGNDIGDFGPNLTIASATPVPELSSLCLVVSGLLGCVPLACAGVHPRAVSQMS